MKLEMLINLAAVAIVSFQLGKKIQEKADQKMIEDFCDETFESWGIPCKKCPGGKEESK